VRESARVEERVTDVATLAEWEAATAAAGGKLVVVEFSADGVCQSGLSEEAELQWRDDRIRALEPCAGIKHSFARCARECKDVTFLAVQQAGDEETSALCDALGVEVLPTLQFWRGGSKLWEHRGVQHLEQDLGEGACRVSPAPRSATRASRAPRPRMPPPRALARAPGTRGGGTGRTHERVGADKQPPRPPTSPPGVLYFGDTAANGVHASDYVQELGSRADLDAFLAKQPAEVLTVLDVSLISASPCIHIFPAVMALAKNFVGYAAFGRLLGDASPAAEAVLRQLSVVEVPTFIFYRGGVEVGRHVGSSRGDLIGKILQYQSDYGVNPPAPERASTTPRRRTSRAAR